MTSKPASWITKISRVVNKDRKQSVLLAGLVLVLIAVWARLIFSGPASATASFIRRSVASMTETPEAPVKPQSSNPLMEWLAAPKRPVDRNLFALHLDYYARAGGGVAEDPAKSLTDATDQDRDRLILLDNLQSQVSKLKLQTTMMGAEPRAMINGQLLKQGDTIGGFSVMKIQARQVTLEQEGISMQIVMP